MERVLSMEPRGNIRWELTQARSWNEIPSLRSNRGEVGNKEGAEGVLCPGNDGNGGGV